MRFETRLRRLSAALWGDPAEMHIAHANVMSQQLAKLRLLI
jgi:hypothetical protein